MHNVVAFERRNELTEELIREAVIEAAETVGLAAVAYSFTSRAESEEQAVERRAA
jgi:hypothetical protein